MYPGNDPQQRIADLERELAEQKRINELQDQLAGARATSRPAFRQQSFRMPPTRESLGMRGMNLFGAVAGFIGFCWGGGSALIAMFPTSALWMSPLICGSGNQMMVNTGHYSYKPNQSGTTVDFECLKADGVYDASWLAISAVQGLLAAIVVAGVIAVVVVVRRMSRRQPVSTAMLGAAAGLGVLAAVAFVFFAFQAFGRPAPATQLPPGGKLTIDGNGETKNLVCNDGHVTVDGREMTVNITGHCASLSVDGVIHHITVDSVDTIDISGIHNVVTYHSGSPKVTNRNGLNTVTQG